MGRLQNVRVGYKTYGAGEFLSVRVSYKTYGSSIKRTGRVNFLRFFECTGGLENVRDE